MCCTHCHNHLGWKFAAVKSNLKPRIFYGLAGKSIQVETLKKSEEDKQEELGES